MAYLDASIQGYLRIRPTIQKSERRTFYGADNFPDDLFVIEYSLPRFATLVPVHALDVLFQKARFLKLVLHLTNDGVRNLDVWTTPIETGMFHLRGTTFMKEVSESDRQLWNVCWWTNLIHQQR
jgi:hypothetical protein